MLTDEQRRHIEAEEQLRYEIRKRLDADNPPPPAPPPPPPDPPSPGFGKRLFDFFNSTLGMWLLSSVVLTGGAALLQNIQHQHEVEMKNREMLATHKFEITNRLDEMEYGLRNAKTVGQAKAAMDSMFKSKFPLTPELQNRSLGSLYLTIYQLVSGGDKLKSAEAINFIRRLEEAELSLQDETDNNKPLDADHKENLRKLLKSIKALHLAAQ
ncbi:hypothetical protein [Reyranella sp.]|uniref:hypothetical protein n=1 Tax=Reyranella sp. TaxID=1929291 RepID=UPI003BADAC51